jgi:hypothetical protein
VGGAACDGCPSPVGTTELSSVPTGLKSYGRAEFPALKRWATIKRPSGAATPDSYIRLRAEARGSVMFDVLKQ